MGKHVREVFHCNTNFLLQCCASQVKSERSRHKTEAIHRPKSDFSQKWHFQVKTNNSISSVYFNTFPRTLWKMSSWLPSNSNRNSSEIDCLCSFQCTLLTQMGNTDHSSYLANNFMMPLILGLFQTKAGRAWTHSPW